MSHGHETTEDFLDDFALEVRKIETEADKIITDAETNKEESISNARSDAAALIKKKQEELEKKRNEKISANRKKTDAEKESKKKEEMKNIKSLEDKFTKNLPKAVDYVLDELDRIIQER
ncbi:hypothetical protein JXC34_05740 [Candidatus Woesearchaeota archaeon]|nr:hypothetical protein [Candidatus Woesearchaeota archaeon]